MQKRSQRRLEKQTDKQISVKPALVLSTRQLASKFSVHVVSVKLKQRCFLSLTLNISMSFLAVFDLVLENRENEFLQALLAEREKATGL